MNKAFEIAIGEYGVKELPGAGTNPRIAKYYEAAGISWKPDDSTLSWCSVFMKWVFTQVGIPVNVDLTARSWLGVGTKVLEPQQGDIAVFWRVSPTDWRGHVGLYVGADEEFYYILGGNQSDGVNIAPRPKMQLLGFRRIEIPETNPVDNMPIEELVDVLVRRVKAYRA